MAPTYDPSAPPTLEDSPIDSNPIGPKPEGYIVDPKPRGAMQSRAARAEARVRQTTKSAIAYYLGTYLTDTGARRNQVELTAPFAGQFVTEISGAANPNDPSIIKTQMARLWTSLRTQLPCIIIVDTSLQTKNPGLGGMNRQRRVPLPWGQDKQVVMTQSVVAKVGIQLMVASLSESESSDLGDVLNFILMQLTAFNKAHLIASLKPEDRWEVRLPMVLSGAGLDRKPINDDPRDSLWSTSIDMEVDFEGEIWHGMDSPMQAVTFTPGDGPTTGIPESPGLRTIVRAQHGCYAAERSARNMVVTAPDEVRFREFPRVLIENAPSGITVSSDNPNVAYVDANRIIHTRNPGTFNLLILKDIGANFEPAILYRKSIPVRV